MAKTAASDVWKEPIKAIGNGWMKVIARCVDIGATTYWASQGLGLSTTAGEFTIFVTGDPDWNAGITVAEDIVNDDRYCLIKKIGAEILHNQKLAGAYKIGTAVYKTAAGTWTVADHDTADSLLTEIGIVLGPADRVTDSVLKDMDDAITATEPCCICL